MSSERLTPPFEPAPLNQRMRLAQEAIRNNAAISTTTSDDNTAAGMALSQEDSMYITPATSPTLTSSDDSESTTHAQTADRTEEDTFKHSFQSRESDMVVACDSNTQCDTVPPVDGISDAAMPVAMPEHEYSNAQTPLEPATTLPMIHTSSPAIERITPPRDVDVPAGLAKVDLSLNRESNVRAWDFTDKRPTMTSSSALFQPYAKYVGTQQSDRQTYNVEVTILTVDLEQSSLSGYLLIRGLTPEHPMLQTFFTGEIVGGPNQKYSFRTMDPAWGANDKVDLQHWLRFPPWRHLTSYAKRDMSFEYPLNNESWSTQEHIFMRWKEHFLVPDHKQSNIQGASFEGFYYICLNQLEGRISGVYFHSKSEKYQQLELTHVTKKGLGIFGVCPLIELR